MNPVCFQRQGKSDRMFFLILDLEATCFGGQFEKGLQEIIEFPAILVRNDEKYTRMGTFHRYVRPTERPILSEFCKQLTGISQNTVDVSSDFTMILRQFQDWARGHGLDPGNCTLITFGSWDLKYAIPNACAACAVEIPTILNINYTKYVNLKKICQRKTGILPPSIPRLMEIVEKRFEGKEHSGIDDVENILTAIRAVNWAMTPTN